MSLDPEQRVSLLRFSMPGGKKPTAESFEKLFGLTADQYDPTLNEPGMHFPEIKGDPENGRSFFTFVERAAAEKLARSGHAHILSCESYDRQEKIIPREQILNFGQLRDIFNAFSAQHGAEMSDIIDRNANAIQGEGINVDLETGKPFVQLYVLSGKPIDNIPRAVGEMELRVAVRPPARLL